MDIGKAISRAFTLPKNMNSLSDVARNPIGAITGAMQMASLASGLGLPIGGTAGALIGGLSSAYDKVAPILSAISAAQQLSEGRSRINELVGLSKEQAALLNEAYRLGDARLNLLLSQLSGVLNNQMMRIPPSAVRSAYEEAMAKGMRGLALAAGLGKAQGLLPALRLRVLANALQAASEERSRQQALQSALREQTMRGLLGVAGIVAPNLGALANASNIYSQLANQMAQVYNIPAMLQGLPQMAKIGASTSSGAKEPSTTQTLGLYSDHTTLRNTLDTAFKKPKL